MATVTYIPGTKGSGTGEDIWVGKSWLDFENARATAFCLGSGWPVPVHYDYSNRRRGGRASPHRAHTVSGLLTGTTGYATPDESRFLTLPITDSDLIAEGTPGEITLAALVRRNATGFTGEIFSTYNSTAGSWVRVYLNATGTLVARADVVGEGDSQVTLGPGASIGDWEIIQATFVGLDVSLYRKGAADSATLTTSGTPSTSVLEGGGRNVEVGTTWQVDPSAGATGGYDIASGAAYWKGLTGEHFEANYASMATFAAPRAITL